MTLVAERVEDAPLTTAAVAPMFDQARALVTDNPSPPTVRYSER